MKEQVAAAGGVLVITLHQPGSEVSGLMDDLLLLAYGGRPVFFGPWGAAMPYFTGHLGLKLPPHTGLADWLLALLDREAAHKQEAARMITVRTSRGSSGAGGRSRSGGGGGSTPGCEVVLGGSSGGAGPFRPALTSSPAAAALLAGGVSAAGFGSRAGSPSLAIDPAREGSFLAAAWAKFSAAGRSLPTEVHVISGDTAALGGMSGGAQHHCLPGLSEISEASDDDADIVITTLVLSEEERAAAAAAAAVQQQQQQQLPSRGPTPTPAAASLGCLPPLQLPGSKVLQPGSKVLQPGASASSTPTGVAPPPPPPAAAGLGVHDCSASTAHNSAIGGSRMVRGVTRAGLGVQVAVLSARALRWWVRNPAMLLSEFLQYLFVVLFLGSLYPR
jgi:hypothetical protein